jgi:hypothetical protein
MTRATVKRALRRIAPAPALKPNERQDQDDHEHDESSDGIALMHNEYLIVGSGLASPAGIGRRQVKLPPEAPRRGILAPARPSCQQRS